MFYILREVWAGEDKRLVQGFRAWGFTFLEDSGLRCAGLGIRLGFLVQGSGFTFSRRLVQGLELGCLLKQGVGV